MNSRTTIHKWWKRKTRNSGVIKGLTRLQIELRGISATRCPKHLWQPSVPGIPQHIWMSPGNGESKTDHLYMPITSMNVYWWYHRSVAAGVDHLEPRPFFWVPWSPGSHLEICNRRQAAGVKRSDQSCRCLHPPGAGSPAGGPKPGGKSPRTFAAIQPLPRIYR